MRCAPTSAPAPLRPPLQVITHARDGEAAASQPALCCASRWAFYTCMPRSNLHKSA